MPNNVGPYISSGTVYRPGVTCFNYLKGTQAASTAAASGGGLDCTHPPIGAILPSGDTVVVFQAQDGYSQAASGNIPGTLTGVSAGDAIPGNRRVMAVEFK
jgi:hypothetical protein